jgi:hypothetical protein
MIYNQMTKYFNIFLLIFLSIIEMNSAARYNLAYNGASAAYPGLWPTSGCTTPYSPIAATTDGVMAYYGSTCYFWYCFSTSSSSTKTASLTINIPINSTIRTVLLSTNEASPSVAAGLTVSIGDTFITKVKCY